MKYDRFDDIKRLNEEEKAAKDYAKRNELWKIEDRKIRELKEEYQRRVNKSEEYQSQIRDLNEFLSNNCVDEESARRYCALKDSAVPLFFVYTFVCIFLLIASVAIPPLIVVLFLVIGMIIGTITKRKFSNTFTDNKVLDREICAKVLMRHRIIENLIKNEICILRIYNEFSNDYFIFEIAITVEYMMDKYELWLA